MICNHLMTFLESSMAASLMGALATIIAVRWTITHEKEKSEIATKEEIRAICSAIKAEIAACFELYMEMGANLEALGENQPFEHIYRVEENYFAVFDGNSSFLGRLSADSRNKIVKAYVDMKSLLDTFRLNNENIDNIQSSLQRLVEIHLANSLEKGMIEQHVQQRLEGYRASAVELAHSLQKKHLKAKESIESALEALKWY